MYSGFYQYYLPILEFDSLYTNIHLYTRTYIIIMQVQFKFLGIFVAIEEKKCIKIRPKVNLEYIFKLNPLTSSDRFMR